MQTEILSRCTTSTNQPWHTNHNEYGQQVDQGGGGRVQNRYVHTSCKLVSKRINDRDSSDDQRLRQHKAKEYPDRQRSNKRNTTPCPLLLWGLLDHRYFRLPRM